MSEKPTEEMLISEESFEELVARVQEFQAGDDAANGADIDLLTGFDSAELQKFLEEKSGIAADEEAQGSVMSAAVSIAWHC